jgi:hypothetical protein
MSSLFLPSDSSYFPSFRPLGLQAPNVRNFLRPSFSSAFPLLKDPNSLAQSNRRIYWKLFDAESQLQKLQAACILEEHTKEIKKTIVNLVENKAKAEENKQEEEKFNQTSNKNKEKMEADSSDSASVLISRGKKRVRSVVPKSIESLTRKKRLNDQNKEQNQTNEENEQTIESNRIICPESGCGKSFVKPSALSRHMRSHTGARPFACNFTGCKLKFAEKGNLKRHLNMHLGVKPFVCKECTMKFARNCHLIQHRKAKHQKETGNRREY